MSELEAGKPITPSPTASPAPAAVAKPASPAGTPPAGPPATELGKAERRPDASASGIPRPSGSRPLQSPESEARGAQISLDTFLQVALRVGVIVDAADHPNADRLIVLKVDIGEAAPRQLVAGIKSAYQPAELIGKRVVVVANLKPAMLRGVESQGMVLAAQSPEGTRDGTTLSLVSPDKAVQPGGTVK